MFDSSKLWLVTFECLTKSWWCGAEHGSLEHILFPLQLQAVANKTDSDCVDMFWRSEVLCFKSVVRNCESDKVEYRTERKLAVLVKNEMDSKDRLAGE